MRIFFWDSASSWWRKWNFLPVSASIYLIKKKAQPRRHIMAVHVTINVHQLLERKTHSHCTTKATKAIHVSLSFEALLIQRHEYAFLETWNIDEIHTPMAYSSRMSRRLLPFREHVCVDSRLGNMDCDCDWRLRLKTLMNKGSYQRQRNPWKPLCQLKQRFLNIFKAGIIEKLRSTGGFCSIRIWIFWIPGQINLEKISHLSSVKLQA